MILKSLISFQCPLQRKSGKELGVGVDISASFS
jgi:hypothetical protein